MVARLERTTGKMPVPHGPIAAVELAEAMNFRTDNRETLRRRVREAVEFARETLGVRICANDQGYWIARNAAEWAAYLNARKAGLRFAFAAIGTAQRAAVEALAEQGSLFGEGNQAARQRGNEAWARA